MPWREGSMVKKGSWWPIIPLGMGVFMVVLDVSVLNIALPSIAEDFHAVMTDVEWILDAYTLTLVVLLVLAGKLGDMVRRDRYYILGMLIFAIGSYLSAESWSIGSLIGFRIIQAVGGAMLSGNALAIMVEIFPPGKRGMAMGINSIITASAFSLGPIIGGWLTTHMGWHWVFYINVPVGIVSIILAWFLFPPLPAKTKEPIDIVGLILLTIGLGALTMGIIKGQAWGWTSQKTLACFIIAFPYLIAFVARELSCDYPLLDPSLFKIRNFTSGIIALSLLFLGLSASLFILPFFLQGIKGLSAEDSGYWLVAIPLVNTIVSPLAGRMSDRANPKYAMVIGPILFAVSLYLLTGIKADIGYWQLFPIFALLGAGIGMLMAPGFNVIMSSVPEEKAGMANGAVRTINTLAQALGVAIGGVLLTKRMGELIPNYGNQLPDPGFMGMLKMLAALGYKAPFAEMTDAFMRSMHYVFWWSILLPVAASVFILFFLSGEEHLESMRRAKGFIMAG